MEAEREAELHSNWPAYVQRLESDRDAGWAAADALANAIRESYRWCHDVERFRERVMEHIAAYTAARAKRTT